MHPRVREDDGAAPSGGLEYAGQDLDLVQGVGAVDDLLGGLDGHALVAQDRKSTRLNSSHHAISYAVFCLKKKNQRL